MLTTEYGDRPEVPNVVILMTDGKSSFSDGAPGTLDPAAEASVCSSPEIKFSITLYIGFEKNRET